jgi:hypothetical protein
MGPLGVWEADDHAGGASGDFRGDLKVLLVDVDSKIANLALMKASAYHKAQGDSVALYKHRGRKSLRLDMEWDPERVYLSCLFTWNRGTAEALSRMWGGAEVLRGGTGFDHGKAASDRAYLPPEIEYAPTDYDLYGYDYAIGFCNRGCNRSCGFCDVPKKEGKIIPANYRPPWTWVPDGFSKAMLLDNDPALYADAQHDEIFEWFIDAGVKCSITQGYDIRCVTPERAALLHELKPRSTSFDAIQLYTAWDYWGIEGVVRERLPVLLDAGFKGRQIRCYTIVGFPQAERAPERCPFDGADLRGPHAVDLHRLNVLWGEYGVYPFVMVYNNERGDPWLRAFARYVNRCIFKSCEWADYKRNPDRTSSNR